MRKTALLIACLLALCVTATSASAKHSRHAVPENCSVRRTHLLAADTQAQVFTALDAQGLFPVIYGCAYGHQRTYLLGGVPECAGGGGGGSCSGIEHPVLAGPIVAFEEFVDMEGSGGGSARWLVVVRDLRTGRVLRRLPTETSSPTGVGPATDIVVKSDGAVAWIVQTRLSTSSHPAEYEVHAADASGSQVLAAGPEIGSSSLALTASTLYWTQAGRAASAALN